MTKRINYLAVAILLSIGISLFLNSCQKDKIEIIEAESIELISGNNQKNYRFS